MVEVVLFNPCIPQNAGNIARTCAVTHSKLTLVRPLGFQLSSKYLKRAGLDYWEQLQFQVVDTLEVNPNRPCYFFSSKAKKLYTEIAFEKDSVLVFGSETEGLPKHFWEKYPESFYTLPMVPGSRSLNLSNAVAIVLYEAIRQRGLENLAHHLS